MAPYRLKKDEKKTSVSENMYKGLPVSEGIAFGKADIYISELAEIIPYRLKSGEVEREIVRYREALEEVKRQLEESECRIRRDIGDEEAEIIKSHMMIVDDPFFQKEVPKMVKEENLNAEFIILRGIRAFMEKFKTIEDDYLRERGKDIEDIGKRVIHRLLQLDTRKVLFNKRGVVFAHDLTPSDTIHFDPKKIKGMVTEVGGETSHAAILARSMGVPTVVGVENILRRVQTNDRIIVDGNLGLVFINPKSSVVKEYRKIQEDYAAYRKELEKISQLPSVTGDNVPFHLFSNIVKAPDVGVAIKYGAEGVGLFRTELPFLLSERLLNEEEQLRIYRTVAEALKGREATIRTLDLGGDKFLPFQKIKREVNPFLGWRSIRISLEEVDVFKVQLRAILRASAYGKIRVLYPMISSLEELRAVNQIFAEVKHELMLRGIPYDESIKSGVMIEVPSAAILADKLIKETDFFSIGTNDLVQYTLAVDRDNEKVSDFYRPYNPSILWLVKRVADVCTEAGKPCSVCGEIAGDPIYAVLLLGCGIRDLSMKSLSIPEVKRVLRSVTQKEAQELVDDALKAGTPEEVNNLLEKNFLSVKDARSGYEYTIYRSRAASRGA